MDKIIQSIPYEFIWIWILGCIVLYIAGSLRYAVYERKTKVTGTQKVLLVCMHVAFVTIGFLTVYNAIRIKPHIASVSPEIGEAIPNDYPLPVTIRFSTIVDFTKLKAYTFPESIGQWSYERITDRIPYGSKITFVPRVALPPGTKIMLYLANIQKPFERDFGSEYLLEFTTKPAIGKVYAKESFADVKPPPAPTLLPTQMPTPTLTPDAVQLAVPFYNQAESFTCNIAAARMLLAYRGITKNEADLKSQIPVSGTRGNGNPHGGYTSNYGTYWEPIARMVSAYRTHQVYEHWNLTDLLKEVARGNPVMTWGQNGWSDPHELSWTNPDGTTIYAVNGMHSVVVTGFGGSPEHPTGISVNDPWRGSYTISPEEFSRRWGFFNVALVVY